MSWKAADHSRLQKILRHWFYTDGAAGLPDDYTCFDIETSGFSPKQDLILEIGWAIVRNRQIIDCDSAVLNWYDSPLIDRNWLTDQLRKTTDRSAANGVLYHFTPERLQAEGGPPVQVLEQGIGLLRSVMRRGEALVGQSVFTFDRRMLNAAKVRFLDKQPVPWLTGGIIDVGLFEKAGQLDTKIPWAGEDYENWLRRCQGGSEGVKWSMFNHIVPKYDLTSRFQLDLSLAHRASMDCRCVWATVETFREIGDMVC